MRKINWGILSTAQIGTNSVIPALQQSRLGTVAAIASRDVAKAREAARRLGIARAYGSYEELLADAAIDAVYIPLPNHLHVPWSLRALDAGKHVLCEKPIGLSSAEGQRLLEAAGRHPRLKVMEAFMYRHHPRWRRARELVADGGIGELRTVRSFFSYSITDPDNIRNRADIGGGGMMDIGCYCVSYARWLFNAEPIRVLGCVEYDPAFGTDRLASGVLDFGRGTSTFTCATQLSPYQHVDILGTEGRIEIDCPANPPSDKPVRLRHQRGAGMDEIVFDPCNQYTLQGDALARAILDDAPVPTPLEDAVANMRVIEAVLASARRGGWLPPGPSAP